MILEASELSSLRTDIAAVLAEAYPDICTIKRLGDPAVTAEHAEIETPVWVTILENVPCKYMAPQPRSTVIGDQVKTQTGYTVDVPAGIDVRQGDRLTIAAKGTDPAFDLEVIDPRRVSNAVIWQLLTIRT